MLHNFLQKFTTIIAMSCCTTSFRNSPLCLPCHVAQLPSEIHHYNCHVMLHNFLQNLNLPQLSSTALMTSDFAYHVCWLVCCDVIVSEMSWRSTEHTIVEYSQSIALSHSNNNNKHHWSATDVYCIYLRKDSYIFWLYASHHQTLSVN